MAGAHPPGRRRRPRAYVVVRRRSFSADDAARVLEAPTAGEWKNLTKAYDLMDRKPATPAGPTSDRAASSSVTDA